MAIIVVFFAVVVLITLLGRSLNLTNLKIGRVRVVSQTMRLESVFIISNAKV